MEWIETSPNINQIQRSKNIGDSVAQIAKMKCILNSRQIDSRCQGEKMNRSYRPKLPNNNNNKRNRTEALLRFVQNNAFWHHSRCRFPHDFHIVGDVINDIFDFFSLLWINIIDNK